MALGSLSNGAQSEDETVPAWGTGRAEVARLTGAWCGQRVWAGGSQVVEEQDGPSV